MIRLKIIDLFDFVSVNDKSLKEKKKEAKPTVTITDSLVSNLGTLLSAIVIQHGPNRSVRFRK